MWVTAHVSANVDFEAVVYVYLFYSCAVNADRNIQVMSVTGPSVK